MRTADEIVARVNEVKDRDPFGFERDVLLEFLPQSHIAPYLREGVDPSEWDPTPLTRESVLEEMREYMAFAWEKALNQRGLSAARSIMKMRSYLWLLEDFEGDARADDASGYGENFLHWVCEKYALPIPEYA